MIDNPITLQQERKVWSIHQSVNGVTYYYNRATKKSQYEMPQCFKTTQQQTDHPEWKEYRTAEGKKFFYNALNRKSSWQLPNEVKEYKRKMEQQKKKQRELNGGAEFQEKLSEEQQKKKKLIALFKAKSVNVNTKWQSCIKMCEDDQRWMLMKISDKKKAFNDYIVDLKKANQIEKKAKTQINKAQFLKMLKQAKFLTSDSKMHKVEYDFLTDPRWRILDDADKKNTFQDYLDELLNKEKQAEKQLKQKNMDNIRLLMETQNIKYNMKWDEFRAKFRNYDCYKNLAPYDRISVFTELIMQIEKKHEEELQKQKRLKERYNRINFRVLLKDKLLSGQIGYKTKWRQFVTQNKQNKDLLNMMDPQQQGSSAHQIFQNFMYQIRTNHKILKDAIKHHFKKKQFKMTEETPFEQFDEKLLDLNDYTSQKDFVRQYIHKYFVQKIKSKNQNKQLSAKKALKKEKKLIFKIFKQLKDNLKTKYSIEDHMQKIQKGMKENGISITHESIFKYYLAFLEGYDEDKKKKEGSRSKSSDRSSVSSHKPKKRSKPQGEQETNGGNLKKFNIPAELKNSMLNDVQEEGQIKDDDHVEDEKKDKKKKAHKKKRKNSSSDSD